MKKNMHFEEWIIAVILCVMVLMVCVQVISRYLFHTSLSHTEELVRYLFVSATFLGAAAAAYRKKHLAVSGMFRFIPDSVVKWIRMSQWLGAFLFTSVMLIFGIRVLLLQMRTHQTTAALGLPMWIIGLVLPACSLVLIIRLVQLAIHTRREV